MSGKVWGEEYRTIYVCIDGYRDGIFGGRLFHPSCKDGKSFQCLSQFLREVERILDDMDFPKAYTTQRTFGPKQTTQGKQPETESQIGLLATFAVRILFRQNASWQGSIVWLEGKQEQSFRSALELIFLISSALEFQEASQTP